MWMTPSRLKMIEDYLNAKRRAKKAALRKAKRKAKR